MENFSLRKLNFIICFLLTQTVYSQGWELKEEKSGIKLYTRNVNGSNVKEFKGEVVVSCNLGGILTLIDDISSYPKWLYNCTYAERLKKITRSSGYTYSVLKTPWPLTDRDAVVYYEVTQDEQTKTVTISIKGTKDYIPLKDDKVRLPSVKGCWQLVPVKKNLTKVIYQLHCEPGGYIPASIINLYITETPYYNLRNLKKIVESPLYPKITMSGVNEPE
jgi:hypothetical protein